MVLSFVEWVQSTSVFTALRQSWLAYPIILSLHMVALAFFGGMVLMTNMRMLGWSMRDRSIADVLERFRVPKRWGLLLIVTCGLLMAGSKAEEYYYNPFFRAKLILLAMLAVHALFFRKSVYADPATLDRTPVIPKNAKVAAALSLVLWASVLCCGRSIGYLQPPLDKIHVEFHLASESARISLRFDKLREQLALDERVEHQYGLGRTR